jgi:hypothetical protein
LSPNDPWLLVSESETPLQGIFHQITSPTKPTACPTTTTFWSDRPSIKSDYIPSSQIISIRDSVISSPPSLLGHFGSYSTQSKLDFGCISPPESTLLSSQISRAKICWSLLSTLAGTIQAPPGFCLQARLPVPQHLHLSHRQISNSRHESQ